MPVGSLQFESIIAQLKVNFLTSLMASAKVFMLYICYIFRGQRAYRGYVHNKPLRKPANFSSTVVSVFTVLYQKVTATTILVSWLQAKQK